MSQAPASTERYAPTRSRGSRRGAARLALFGAGLLAGLGFALALGAWRTARPAGGTMTAVPGLAAPAPGAEVEPRGAGADSWSLAAASGGRGTPQASDATAHLAAAALRPLGSAMEIVVRRDDPLDAIFRRLSLPVADLAAVRNLPGIRHALDALKPGDVIRLTSLNGGLNALERRLNDTETLSVARAAGGEFAASVIANPLEIHTTALHGRIDSSLYRTVNDLGASDLIASELAEVFRYDLDFAQELQPGDSFTIVLEQMWRDGRFLRDGEILAAEFVNNGRSYRALRYALPDGRHEYYTPEGRSVRKAFLRAPLQFSRISSGFGLRWHPLLNHLRAHRGIDYAAPTGTPVQAAGAGRVRYRGEQSGYGNLVILAHPGGIETVYGHLSHFAKGLYVGKRVNQGELLGYVGISGLATGPHLHYEYRVGGVHRNPASVKNLPAEPLAPALQADFESRARVLLASLDAAARSAELVAVPRAASAP